MDKWMDEDDVVCILYTYYSAIKKMESCHLKQDGWTDIKLSEVSQSEKDICVLF